MRCEIRGSTHVEKSLITFLGMYGRSLRRIKFWLLLSPFIAGLLACVALPAFARCPIQRRSGQQPLGALVAITAPFSNGSGPAVQVRTGVILLVRVLGDVKAQLTLDSLTVPRFAESPPIALEMRFRNEGTVHEAPSGDIEVRNMFGWLVATATLAVRKVLPGVVRKSRHRSVTGCGWGATRFYFTRRTAYLSAIQVAALLDMARVC